MFDEMLRISGALDHGPANILELGCGCVEGALSILSSRSQDLASYVGLNINGVQTNFCQERLQQWTSQQRQTGGLKVPQTLSVFRADASRPDTWSPDLAKDLETALLFDNDNSSGYPPRNNWVIAADCLYHFKAGREKILSHVCKHFGASLVATDYIQPDNMTGMQQFLLAVFLEMIQVPWPNKLTRQEYIDLLVRCGYDKSSVQIVDITDHVWTPYADFLKRQTARWDEIGGSPEAVRPFRHFGWVMRYFAYAGTLRQVIVVARTRREPSDSKE